MEKLLDIEDFEITIKINSKGSMRAQVGITYGPIRINGYRIMQPADDDNLFLQAPSIKPRDKWIILVRINDPELWKDLEEKAILLYNQKIKLQGNDNEEAERVDPREIPM